MDEKRTDLIASLDMLFNWGELDLAQQTHRRIGELYLDKGQVIFQEGDFDQSGTYLLYMSENYYTVVTYDTETDEFDNDEIDVDEIVKWVRLEG